MARHGIPQSGEAPTAREGDDDPPFISDARLMEAMAMDLIRQVEPAARLASLPLLVSVFVLVGFVFTGIPGRTVLEFETRLEIRRERRRLEMIGPTSDGTDGSPAISGADVKAPA